MEQGAKTFKGILKRNLNPDQQSSQQHQINFRKHHFQKKHQFQKNSCKFIKSVGKLATGN
jgi:hypothetical protein